MAKKNKRNDGYLSIRKKLIAAVAMLLVASFMVASSSYAWFTLSTAPEITGIQTAVGANGNLEMALYAGADPTSAVGDSLKSVLEKNLTWGNLVDLSDSAYGLQLISLLPARLNVASVTDGKATITTGAPLMTPKYAADGRIEKLEGNTSVGAYKAADSSFAQNNPSTGVYAIGNSNNETAQQRDYRNSLVQLGTYISTARSSAIKSLSKVGNDLGSYAAQHASKTYDPVDGDKGPYDLTNTLDMINNMKTASTALDNAMISLAKLAYAAKTTGDDYTTWAPSNDQKDDALEAYEYVSGLNADYPNFVAVVGTINAKRLAVKTAVTEAETAYTAAQARITAATWDDLKAICGPLVNVDLIKINNKLISELNTPEGRQELVNAAFSNTGLLVQMPKGSGAYADIAQIVGNYTIGITLVGLSYNGINAPDMPAKMQTTIDTADIVNAQAASDFPANPTGTSSNPTITDMYGYKIDMAFRTNASESQLMLQTEAAGRIYSSGASEQTMGKGSTMTFATEAAGFTVEQMISLMGSVRILFTDINGNVVALAGLDTANVEAAEGGALNVSVRIFDDTKYSIAEDGTITFTLVDGKKVFVDGDKAAIMALDANAVETLSVYVYLDGDSVENKDVAATTSESMAGTLNLQFSSSAALVPMNYAPLKSDTTVTPPANP